MTTTQELESSAPIPVGHEPAGEPIHGTTSTYYPVLCSATQRRCVVVRPRPGADTESLRLFESEATRAGEFQCPSLVPIRRVDRDALGPYCVVDADHDTTLHRALDDRVLRGDELLRLLIAVAEAVKEVHDRGFAHGGIHPSHVLLQAHGGIRLSGFGISEIGVAPRPAAASDPYLEVEVTGGVMMPSIPADLRAFARLISHAVTRELPVSITPEALAQPYVDIVSRCMSEDPNFRIRRFDEVLLTLTLASSGVPEPLPEPRALGDPSVEPRLDPIRDAESEFPWRPLGDFYEIIGEPVRGGMGTVIKARDRFTGKLVAIKRVMRELRGRGDGQARRFVREARSIACLNHPNILSLLFVGRDHHGEYIVFEWADGGSLFDRMAAVGPMSSEEVVSIARKIGSALAYAHGKGVIHRDIKPHNVLLTEGLEPKLGDFGLARAADDATLTVSHMSGGTPLYAAPEQMRDLRSADVRSDVYSFGRMLYQLTTGELPATIDIDRLPQVLRDPVDRCLKEDRAERFTSFEEFLARLDESAANDARRDAGVRDMRPRYSGVTVVAVLALCTAMTWFVTHRNKLDHEPSDSTSQIAAGDDARIANAITESAASGDDAPSQEPEQPTVLVTASDLLARLESIEKDRNRQLAIASDMKNFAIHLSAFGEVELAKTISDSMECMRVASDQLDLGITTAKEFALRPDARSFDDALIDAERLASVWNKEWEDEFRTIVGHFRFRVAMDESTLANSMHKKFALRRRAELIKFYLDDVSSIEIDDTLRDHLFNELYKHMDRAYGGKVRQADCSAYKACLMVLNRLRLTEPPIRWEDNVRASMARFDELSTLLHVLDAPQPFDIDVVSKALFDYKDYCDIDESFYDGWKQKIDDVRRLKMLCFDDMDRPAFDPDLRKRMKLRLEQLVALVSVEDPDVKRWMTSIVELEKLRPELLSIIAKHDDAKSVVDYDQVQKLLNTFLTSGMKKSRSDKLVGTVYYAHAVSQIASGREGEEQEAWYEEQMDVLNTLVYDVDMKDDVRVDGVSLMLWAKYQLFEVSAWNYEKLHGSSRREQFSREGRVRAFKIYDELSSSAYFTEVDRDGRRFSDKMKETMDRLK